MLAKDRDLRKADPDTTIERLVFFFDRIHVPLLFLDFGVLCHISRVFKVVKVASTISSSANA